jgi:hypothetical protein
MLRRGKDRPDQGTTRSMSEPSIARIAAITGIFIVASVFGFFNWLFKEQPESSFARDLIVAFVALPLGIPFGLWVNRRLQRTQERGRRAQLLKQLASVLNANVGYLRQAHNVMLSDVYKVPSFPLDLVTLEATANVRYELLYDHSLREAIDKAHFELRHVNRRFEILVDRAVYDPRPPVTPESMKMIADAAAQYHETERLSRRLLARVKPDEMSQADYECFELKISTISLAVGLTSVHNPRPAEVSGGAIHWCNEALKAIGNELARHGD